MKYTFDTMIDQYGRPYKQLAWDFREQKRRRVLPSRRSCKEAGKRRVKKTT